MTEDTSKTGLEAEEETFSLDDIDSLIAKDDPNFLEEMSDIESVGNDADAYIESLDPEAESEEETPLKLDLPTNRKEQIIYKVLVIQTKIKNSFSFARQTLLNVVMQLKEKAKSVFFNSKKFVRHELPERIQFYQGRSKAAYETSRVWIQGQLSRYKGLTKLEKTCFWGISLAGALSLLAFVILLRGGYLPKFHDPLVKSLNVKGQKIKFLKDRSQVQDLFHAFPDVEFFVLLKKVVVNLKPDSQSSKNPMGLYEVYLGLDSQDTAIEVKDREREILDIIQRGLESFTYSDTGSQVGKVRMKTVIRDRVNEALNQGRVFHVYFNNFVTKQ